MGISISDGNQLKVPREYKRGLKLDVYKLLKYNYKVDPANTDFEPLFFERILGRLNYWKQVEPHNQQVDLLIGSVRDRQKAFISSLS